MTTATVKLWGTPIGYASMRKNESFARFEYDSKFIQSGIDLAPIMMPVQTPHVYQFPELHKRTFHGLPGLLADSLPDKYGNRLIDVWLAQTGRLAKDFNAVDRLCYTGNRGMGALEFEPAMQNHSAANAQLEVRQLVELASMAFADKSTLHTNLDASTDNAILDILSVGTSAGGARAKAVIAFDPVSLQVRSGQLNLPEGFEHWLIKFDGVQFNGDWGVADPTGYGLCEYSYYKMAKLCGIEMMESRLFVENGRNHFMTKRFDRDEQGGKFFVQTLGALMHFDYWESGYYAYEQLFMTMKQLSMAQASMEQQFLRVIFNLVACNQDDHVKNFAFMMNRKGNWSISPAYDLCHSEGSAFTKHHQLSINSKTTGFNKADLKHLASYAGLARGREKHLLEKVVDVFASWHLLADELNIPAALKAKVLRTLRLSW